MYKNFGYVIYQQIIEYYSGDTPEDAYGLFHPYLFFQINYDLDFRYAQGLTSW